MDFPSYILTNFKFYLIPVPLISVKAGVRGPSSKTASPSNFGCPLDSKSTAFYFPAPAPPPLSAKMKA